MPAELLSRDVESVYRDNPYWAASSDSEDIMQTIEERRRSSENQLNGSRIFSKVVRSARYYFGYFQDDWGGWGVWGDTDLQAVGEHGQILNMSVNYYRYLIRQQLAMVTAEKPQPAVMSANTDYRSRIQTRLGKKILSFYHKKRGIDAVIDAGLEDALVHGLGFIRCTWEPWMGQAMDADEATQSVDYQGDIWTRCYDFLDVVWDWGRGVPWEEQRWVATRTPVNRWELAARFFDNEDAYREILSADDDEEATSSSRVDDEKDDVSFWEFFHAPTEAMPQGRYFAWVGETPLMERAFPYSRLPVHAIQVGRVRNTSLGWAPAFDIQKEQELLNELWQKLATQYDHLGLPLLWTELGTAQPDPSLWLGNISWLESQTKPEVVQLVDVPDDIFVALAGLKREMDDKMGISSAARGEAEGSVRANRMQVFMAEKARQFHGPIFDAYYRAHEFVDEMHLELLRKFPTSQRTITVLGKEYESARQAFKPEDLSGVAGVAVTDQATFMRTLEGRLEVLGLLTQAKVPIPKEEIVALINGQPLEAATEGISEQLEQIARENEMLMAGKGHVALVTDNQLLHMKKHAQLLDNPALRMDPDAVRMVSAALLEHITYYNNPAFFNIQLALGYAEVPPDPMMAMIQGGAGQAPPEEAEPEPEAQEEATDEPRAEPAPG